MLFGGYRETVEIVETVDFVLFVGYRETVISLISLQPRRVRPVDEAAKARLAAQPSRVQRTKQARRSRGSGLSFARARRRPKQKQGTATRSSAPVFASGHRPAPRKSAKRKSEYVMVSTASMRLTVCRSAGPSVAPLGQRAREGRNKPALPVAETAGLFLAQCSRFPKQALACAGKMG